MTYTTKQGADGKYYIVAIHPNGKIETIAGPYYTREAANIDAPSVIGG